MQIIIEVPDSLPKEILKHKIIKIEADLKKEAEALKKNKK